MSVNATEIAGRHRLRFVPLLPVRTERATRQRMVKAMAKAKEGFQGRYVQNNSDGTLVVSELGPLGTTWNPAGAPDHVHFVPQEQLETSAALQRMLHTLIPGTDKTVLEIVKAEDYNKQVEKASGSKKQEYGDLLVTPQDEGILYCSAKDEKGEPICRVYTSDPNEPRPFYCRAHAHMREEDAAVAPEERERLKPQRKVMGPKADKPAVVPQHILGEDAGSKIPTGMSLEDLEAKVESTRGKP